MFVPVSIGIGAGGQREGYSRIIETAARFDVLGRNVEDMRVPFTRVGEDLHAQMSAAFASQGGTGASGRWTQLSPAYGAWKEKHAPGTPILVGLRPTGAKGQRPQSYGVSGRMRRQLLVPVGDRSTWHIGPRRMLYAPLSDIAGFHQTGTSRMPARPPVDVSLTFLHSIDRQFARWMRDLAVAAGLSGPGSAGPRG